MANDAEILSVVEALAVDQFSRKAIEGVRARRDLDGDGDPIIWIDFLMRDGVMPLDPKVTLPFRSTVRQAVRDLGEIAFPIPSFYPISEYRRIRPEAA